MSIKPPLFKIPLQFRSKVSAGGVLRQAANCHAGCTRKDQKYRVWMSAVCIDEQNILIRAVTCPGFLKVTDAGAACSVSIGRVVVVNTP